MTEHHFSGLFLKKSTWSQVLSPFFYNHHIPNLSPAIDSLPQRVEALLNRQMFERWKRLPQWLLWGVIPQGQQLECYP
jgi:hypothetical protein